MSKSKSKKYEYGKSPAPSNWSEAADALKSLQKPKRKGGGLVDRLDSIEQLIKDHK